MHKPIRNIVIVGGGTAGWMAATALSTQLGSLVKVTLVESEKIGTIGVGESTIPPLRLFHRTLKIAEPDFMRATSATFKLGISFEGWWQPGQSYIHAFGTTGQESWMAGFQNLWLLAKDKGIAREYGDYCFEAVASKHNKFLLAQNQTIHYSYHVDATAYAKFLRNICERTGVIRREGKVEHVIQNHDTGYIESVKLDSGKTIEGDLFVDCTGFRGVLIEKTLNTGYEDWGHWLPCDRAIAAQTEISGPLVPYTRAIAHKAGWRWRIPLQTRTGNGLVYSSKYLSDDEALKFFLEQIDGSPITEPNHIQYKTGRRLKAWNKNCIALGLSSGFVEPVESTGIHLFMTGITRLLQLFPFAGIAPSVIKEYNAQTKIEMEKIRDFIILHYHLNQRNNDPFWRHCRDMELPEDLQEKIDLFKESANTFHQEGDTFRPESWTQVMLGQGIMPERYHQVAKNIPDAQIKNYLEDMRASLQKRVDAMPTHQEFVSAYCGVGK